MTLAKKFAFLKSFGRLEKAYLTSLIIFAFVLPIAFAFSLKSQKPLVPETYLVSPITPPVPPTPSPVPILDPQTKEMYDIDIQSNITTIINQGGGPVYLTSTVFRIGGQRVSNINQLFGYIQKPAVPYEPNVIQFNYSPGKYPPFISSPVNLLFNNCIDLYSSAEKKLSNYIATFCYKNSVTSPQSKNQKIYSYNANPFIIFDYQGSKITMLQFLTTGFNKFNNNLPPYNGGNQRGTRVNYLTIDQTSSSLADFKNVRYFIQGLTGGLSNQEYADLCNLGPNYSKKYLKQTSEPKPEGGNSYQITKSLGACSFEYDHHALIPFFLSLYKNNSPYSTPTPSTLPSASPSLKPTSLKPDLTIPYFSVFPRKVKTKKRVLIKIKLKNKGQKIAKNFNVSLYQQYFSFGQIKLQRKIGQLKIKSLKPGQSKIINYYWRPANNSKTIKKYLLTAYVDKKNKIKESNEKNNQAKTIIIVLPASVKKRIIPPIKKFIPINPFRSFFRF